MTIQLNGGGLGVHHKSAPRVRRTGVAKRKAPGIPDLVKYWPGAVALGALLMSFASYLNATGFIDPMAHKNDIKEVASDVATLKENLKKNDADHTIMQTDIKSVLGAVGRIEGMVGQLPVKKK